MLIPDNIKKFDSTGERILFLKFQNDRSTKGMYILHSLFTNQHLKNISGELDFLVLAPNKGIFAIEVKHGKVYRKNGLWNFENRLGAVTSKYKSPFAQVDGTMNSIRKFLLKKVERNKEIHKRLSMILWGTGVAFTSMNELIDFGPEGHSWQILTRDGMKLPIGYYIEALSKGWHKENRGKYWYDANSARPTDKDCKLLMKILRGDFEIDYSEINKIADNDYLIEEYTKEQFHLLDFASYNKRCLIEGAAGTGKTLMALELFRREMLFGKKVGLLCYNNQLGGKLQTLTDTLSQNKTGSFVSGSFHSYLIDQVKLAPPVNKENIPKFFNEDLPFEFLFQNENINERDKFDVLILDEAQDLITPINLEIFDLILKGGITDGNWMFFGDFSNQAIYLNEPEETMNLLFSRSNFTRFPPLKINCRNTKKIASQNTLLTGVDTPVFTSKSIEGVPIVNNFPAKKLQQNEIENLIKELVQKGIPLNKVTLLSPRKFEKSILKDSELITKQKQNGLETHTIHAFKGLENTFVILYDFSELKSVESQRLLYVGISRARQQLYIVLDNSLEKEYKELIQANIKKISKNGY